MSIFKRKTETQCMYAGDYPDEIIEAYCCNCKCKHELPRKEWIVVMVGQKIKFECKDSTPYSDNREYGRPYFTVPKHVH